MLKRQNNHFFDGSFIEYGENLRKTHLKKNDDLANTNEAQKRT
tara:strand:- start:2171 stop:2299 length:129 start_codon:yes stop_codon:yes gene_type:complete